MTEDEAVLKANEKTHLPCCIKCTDKNLSNSMKNSSNNLRSDGLKHQFNEEEQVVAPEQPEKFSSLAKAVNAVKQLMLKLDHRLYRGSIYVKIPEG